jgi:hypothetical protein
LISSAAGIAYSQAVFTFDRALTAEEIKALSGAVESCKTYAANSYTSFAIGFDNGEVIFTRKSTLAVLSGIHVVFVALNDVSCSQIYDSGNKAYSKKLNEPFEWYIQGKSREKEQESRTCGKKQNDACYFFRIFRGYIGIHFFSFESFHLALEIVAKW